MDNFADHPSRRFPIRLCPRTATAFRFRRLIRPEDQRPPVPSNLVQSIENAFDVCDSDLGVWRRLFHRDAGKADPRRPFAARPSRNDAIAAARRNSGQNSRLLHGAAGALRRRFTAHRMCVTSLDPRRRRAFDAEAPSGAAAEAAQ